MARLCEVDGCGRPVRARRLCKAHYARARRNDGDYLADLPIGPARGTSAAPLMPNPWAGRQTCPTCGSSAWTLPWEPGQPLWRCAGCHVNFCEVAG